MLEDRAERIEILAQGNFSCPFPENKKIIISFLFICSFKVMMVFVLKMFGLITKMKPL